MNVELLHQIKAAILAEPDAFRMDVWSCGTAHCIAGWACHMSGRPVRVTPNGIGCALKDGGDTREVACNLLGIDSVDADSLFCTTSWPEDLERAYYDAQEGQDRVRTASVAAQRIDRYIATDGAE